MDQIANTIAKSTTVSQQIVLSWFQIHIKKLVCNVIMHVHDMKVHHYLVILCDLCNVSTSVAVMCVRYIIALHLYVV